MSTAGVEPTITQVESHRKRRHWTYTLPAAHRQESSKSTFGVGRSDANEPKPAPTGVKRTKGAAQARGNRDLIAIVSRLGNDRTGLSLLRLYCRMDFRRELEHGGLLAFT
jgi:hypothetical protein